MHKTCQSCAMHLNEDADFGSNKDEKINHEYCRYCFKDGQFTSSVTMDEFIRKQIQILTTQMNLSEDKAKEIAEIKIPTLNRWKE